MRSKLFRLAIILAIAIPATGIASAKAFASPPDDLCSCDNWCESATSFCTNLSCGDGSYTPCANGKLKKS